MIPFTRVFSDELPIYLFGVLLCICHWKDTALKPASKQRFNTVNKHLPLEVKVKVKNSRYQGQEQRSKTKSNDYYYKKAVL